MPPKGLPRDFPSLVGPLRAMLLQAMGLQGPGLQGLRWLGVLLQEFPGPGFPQRAAPARGLLLAVLARGLGRRLVG